LIAISIFNSRTQCDKLTQNNAAIVEGFPHNRERSPRRDHSWHRLVESLQRMQRNAAIIKQSRVRMDCDCPVHQSEGCYRIVVLKLNRAQTDAGHRRFADSVREFFPI
jgi:hypothetical protein